jgi:hypothetical protein
MQRSVDCDAQGYLRCVLDALRPLSRGREYNAWYDEKHLPQVCASPGFLSAQRFKVRPSQLSGSDEPPVYPAIYQLDADDLDAA